MKFNKKTVILLAVLIILALAIGLGLRAMSQRANARRQPPPEMVVAVERGDLEVWVTGNGLVAAAVKEEVKSPVSGTIERYLLAGGKEVAAGEELVAFKLQDLSLQIEQAELDLTRLEQELKNLKSETTGAPVAALESGTLNWTVRSGDWVQRGVTIALLQVKPPLNPGSKSAEGIGAEEKTTTVEIKAPLTGTITRLIVQSGENSASGDLLAEITDLDRFYQIEQQIPLKEIQIRQARLTLSDLQQKQQENRNNRIVTSPINGTVILPQPNQAAAGMDLPQGAILATIVDYSQLEVIVPIDELDISRVKVGQKVKLTVDALPGEIISGEVGAVAPEGKGQGGAAAFDVTIVVAGVQGLKAGMSAGASILVETRSDVLLAPIEAVFEEEGESMVMAAAEQDKGELRAVKVTTGAYNASLIEILSGVREGQQIVIQSTGGGNLNGGMMGGFGPMRGGADRD